jgi:hypothetical protein
VRHVIVCGIPTVKRAVIQTLDGKGNSKKRYQLFVEGTGLQEVMASLRPHTLVAEGRIH